MIAVNPISALFSTSRQSRRSRPGLNTFCCILWMPIFPSHLSITSSSASTLSATVASTTLLHSFRKSQWGFETSRPSVLSQIASLAVSSFRDILNPWARACSSVASAITRCSFRDPCWMLWNMTLMNLPWRPYVSAHLSTSKNEATQGSICWTLLRRCCEIFGKYYKLARSGVRPYQFGDFPGHINHAFSGLLFHKKECTKFLNPAQIALQDQDGHAAPACDYFLNRGNNQQIWGVLGQYVLLVSEL